MKPHLYGIICGIIAFLVWGALPLYWKQLESIPPLTITAHRLVWSTVTLLIILIIRGRFSVLIDKIKQPKTLIYSTLTGLLLFSNWLIYVWAVNSGMIVSVSFGYFVLPIIYIVIGYFMLKESMSRMQIIAVAIATLGVLVQGIGIGAIPWVALSVACTFAVYGVSKKKMKSDGFTTLTIEVGALSPFAIYYLYQQHEQQNNVWLDGTVSNILLIALSGLATITPLLFFTAAAKRIPLNLLGILQFIAPTGQFMIGILYYQEMINLTQVIAFSLIWIAITIYSISKTKLVNSSS